MNYKVLQMSINYEDWLNDKVNYYFNEIKNSNESFVIICSANEDMKFEYGANLDPEVRGTRYWCKNKLGERYIEFGQGCRVLDKISYDGIEYIVIACTPGTSLIAWKPYKCKGNKYKRSVGGTEHHFKIFE